MKLEYGLEETRVEVSEREFQSSTDFLEQAETEEQSRGRKFTVSVRFNIHQPTPKETRGSKRSTKLFPRPVRSFGALTPEVVADGLKNYATRREQPASDVSRVLWTEFLAAVKRDGPNDKWTKKIEEKLDDVRELRASRLPMSYAHIQRRQRGR
jgi:hypothetical protein